MKYKAVFFHPEGDFVSDFRSNSVSEVWEHINNMGSKWISYPICFVATEKVIVSTPKKFMFLKGKHITTAKKYFSANKSRIILK